MGSTPDDTSHSAATSSPETSRQRPVARNRTLPSIFRTRSGVSGIDQSQRHSTSTRPRSGKSATVLTDITRPSRTSMSVPSGPVGEALSSSKSRRGSIRLTRRASSRLSVPRNSTSGGESRLTMRTTSGGRYATLQLPSMSGFDLPTPENKTRYESSSLITHQVVG